MNLRLRQRNYAESINEPVNGKTVKYILMDEE